MIEGKIESGLGEGAYFVEKYAKLFEASLGFMPFFGTLNVRVKEMPELKNPITITPGGNFKPVHCYKANFNGKRPDAFGRPFTQAAVIRPVATRHPKEIIEIIAPVCIKEKYGLKDGDKFTCSLG